MNPRCLLLVTAVAVHWKITVAIPVPEGDGNNEETARIINGIEAKRGQFPYAIAIYQNGNFICTGCLISLDYVLTAAHCCSSNNKTADPRGFVLVANYDRSAPDQRVGVSKIMVHEGYDANSIENDLAVLKTNITFKQNDEVRPIPLAKPKPNKTDECPAAKNYETVYAMGWGTRTPLVPTSPQKLQYGEQEVICNEECKRSTSGVKDTNICANGKARFLLPGSSVCNGDSGGPLVEVMDNRGHRLIGTTSYGVITCVGTRAVFTRIDKYNEWILSRTDNVTTLK